MSVFRPAWYSEEPTTFNGLFRLLDEFENYNRDPTTGAPRGRGRHHGRHHAAAVFTPRFDLRETEKTFELHGELPGLDRKDVTIEFTEPQTMVIHGRTERSYTVGTPPAGLVEDVQMSGAITEAGEPGHTTHPATVSDEDAEAAKEKGEVVPPKQKEGPKQQQPRERYWYQERSVGEFTRTFSFPSPVDEGAVTATLKDGILNITVPKAQRSGGRKVTVN